MSIRVNQIELYTNNNQKAYTNIATSTTFDAHKIITSNIDDANVIVITCDNAAPKKVNANRTTIVFSSVAYKILNVYMIIIK